MIIDVVGVPQVSLLDARLLCDCVGVRIGYLRHKAPVFQTFRPRIQSYFGPLRVLYIDDLLVFNQYADSIYQKKQHHVILLNAAFSTLKEVGVNVHGNGTEPFLHTDLIALFGSAPINAQQILLSLQHNLAEQIMQSINKESLLGKLQTSFYRIKQVDERQRMQSLVFAYLSGSIKRRPFLDIPYIDKLLNSDLCGRFVTAIAFAKKAGPDKSAEEFGIDRFEIAYVLKRSGYSLDGDN